MLQKTVSLTMSILLAISVLAFAFSVQTVKAQGVFIHIYYDGTIDGTTDIQSSDNVTYYFTNNINGSIYVERDDIVIDGNGYTLQGSGTGIGISMMFIVENMTVRNLCIKNFETGIIFGERYYDRTFPTHFNISANNIENNNYGIRIYHYSNISIIGNNITDNYYGMSIEFSFNNTINANYISTNDQSGIYLDSCSFNSITMNNLTANGFSGILLSRSTNNSISGNNFISNGLDFWNSNHNSVKENTVNGKPLVYLEEIANYSVGEAGQVILVNCSNIRVENLNLSNATIGLELCWTNNSIISSNNLTANSLWGILLYSSCNNSITGNNVANDLRGIWLDFASNYNTITGNNIAGSTQGGVNIVDESRYNTVYYNNFIDNLMLQVFATDMPNFFDDGSFGNYWSDYQTRYPNATQTNGVWNTPYSIDTNNTDHHPLVNQSVNQIPEFPSITIVLLFVLSTALIARARTAKTLKTKAYFTTVKHLGTHY